MKKTAISIILAVIMMSVAFGQEKRYEIESAIIKKNAVIKAQGMPTEQKMSSIQYFAEYGNKESTESSMEMQGQTISMFNMIKDGYMYSASLNFKQGTKINTADIENFNIVNFLNLTDEIKTQYQIQANGVEQVLGKPCNRYEMNYTAQGQTAISTVWIWQGIILKSKITASGTIAEEEATEILEGAAIAPEKFELPEGITFTEHKP